MALPMEDMLAIIVNREAFADIMRTLEDGAALEAKMGAVVKSAAFGGSPLGQADLGGHVGKAHLALKDSLASVRAGLGDYLAAIEEYRESIERIDDRDEAFMTALQQNLESRNVGDQEGTS